MSRDNTVPVRLSDIEKEALTEMATRSGLTASGWIRWIVNSEAAKRRGYGGAGSIFEKISAQLDRIEALLLELTERGGE